MKVAKFFIILSMIIPTVISAVNPSLKEYEKWWEFKCREKKSLEDFNFWQGGENAISRILARLHIMNKGYQSVLDIPCGLAVDYEPLKKSRSTLDYLAIDISANFIAKVTEKGIPAMTGRIQDIPCDDNAFEVVYSRFILEHLDSYKDALEEMVRVASKEVLVVFFIKPTSALNDKMVVSTTDGYPIYHNQYSKSKMEAFLRTLPKVKEFSWQEVKSKDECILHIYVS